MTDPTIAGADEAPMNDEFEELYDTCWNCGGEGFVSDCFEEFACIDPEGGCDLCTRRCDVCNVEGRVF